MLLVSTHALPGDRDELIETCKKLMEAPDEYAEMRLRADVLLTQVELAQSGASTKETAEALSNKLSRPFKPYRAI